MVEVSVESSFDEYVRAKLLSDDEGIFIVIEDYRRSCGEVIPLEDVFELFRKAGMVTLEHPGTIEINKFPLG